MPNHKHVLISCFEIPPGYVGGINTFVHGLLSGLVSQKSSYKYTILCSGENAEQFKKYCVYENFNIEYYETHVPFKTLCVVVSKLSKKIGNQLLYEIVSTYLFKKLSEYISKNFDLAYFPATTIFPTGIECPCVVSMHDIQHEHFPENFTLLQRNERKVTFEYTIKKANFIQASSQFILNDLNNVYGKKVSNNIVVISEGVDNLFWQDEKNINNLAFQNIEHFFFFPAQFWPHKNHITVMRALKLLKDKHRLDISVMMTGGMYSEFKRINDYICTNNLENVKYLGKVSVDELRDLYKRSIAVLVPSIYESSSLPLLEAISCSTPVIASNTPPNKEMEYFFDIEFFDVYDHAKLSQILMNYIQPNRVKISNKNKTNIQLFSWENIASKYLNLFDSIIHQSK
jgi:glycosyltransferase involved in cell wall biosynthesis